MEKLRGTSNAFGKYYDDFDIDFEKESEIFKAIMPKLHLKENIIYLASTPSEKKGFFYDLWMAKT